MSFLDQYKAKGGGQAADAEGPATQIGEDFGRSTTHGEAADIDLDMDVGAPRAAAASAPARAPAAEEVDPFAITATSFPRTGAGLAPPVGAPAPAH